MPFLQPDDTTPSVPSLIKTHIFEIAEVSQSYYPARSFLNHLQLYTHHYPELLTSSSSVETYVRALWELLGGGSRIGVSYDGVRLLCVLLSSHPHFFMRPQLVSQSLRFLSTAIRSGNYKQIFEAKETIAGLVEGVVVPNVGLRGMQRS